jgi:hypothetical protein
MRKKALYFLLSISIMTTMLFGCNKNTKNPNSNIISQVQDTFATPNDGAEDISDYDKHSPLTSIGYVIGFSDEKSNTYKNASINVEPSKDFKFTVDATYTVSPATSDIDYAITAFIDYKQVEFSVGNDTTKIKKYISKAKDNTPNKIDITLPTSSLSGSHKLTIISQCIKYAGQTRMVDSICKNVNLNIGKETTYSVKDKKTTGTEISYPIPIDSRSIVINRDFVIENEINKTMMGDLLVIKTKKGKELSLAVRVPQANNDRILFLTMNNEQIPIDGQKYLYFSGMKNPMFKKLTIKTPDIPGEYSLNRFFVQAPWDKTSDLTALCSSIKLVVE